MANEIIAANASNPEYSAALALHQQIITNGTIAANALLEMCRCLKQMRDDKLYTALGYDDFGVYCEDKANIKSRQAYTYIKIYEELPPAFLQSNANLGVTKLELLTHVNPLDRKEFMEQVNADELTVNELKAEIERLKVENCEKGEQLSLFEDKTKSLEKEKRKESMRATDLEQQLKVLSEKPAEVAVREPDPEEIDKLVQQAIADDKAKHDKEIQKLKTKLDKAKRQKTVLQAEVDSTKSISDEQIKQLKDKLAKAESGADAQLIEFKHYFKNLQEGLQKFVNVLKTVEDEEKRAKFKAAAVKYINMVLEDLENET